MSSTSSAKYCPEQVKTVPSNSARATNSIVDDIVVAFADVSVITTLNPPGQDLLEEEFTAVLDLISVLW